MCADFGAIKLVRRSYSDFRQVCFFLRIVWSALSNMSAIRTSASAPRYILICIGSRLLYCRIPIIPMMIPNNTRVIFLPMPVIRVRWIVYAINRQGISSIKSRPNTLYGRSRYFSMSSSRAAMAPIRAMANAIIAIIPFCSRRFVGSLRSIGYMIKKKSKASRIFMTYIEGSFMNEKMSVNIGIRF